jgi:hypothetical protein
MSGKGSRVWFGERGSIEGLVPTEERVDGLLDGSDDLSRIEEMPH